VSVVSNSGPLIALAKLGQVHVLHSLYGPVLTPPPVYEEVVVSGLAQGANDAASVQMAIERQHLRIVEINEQDLSPLVAGQSLDRGEKHAIQLAIEENAEQVLLDDLLAREAAKKLGLKVKGTLGVFVDAARKGVLSSSEIDIIFDALLKRGDIWIAENLIYRVWDQLKREFEDD